LWVIAKVPLAAWSERGHSHGDVSPDLSEPLPINYRDSDLKTLLSAAQEGLSWTQGLWGDITLAAWGVRKEDEDEIKFNGGGTNVVVFNGRDTGPSRLASMVDWMGENNMKTTHSGVKIHNDLYAPLEEGLSTVDGIDGAVVLLGHSMGGPFSRKLARLRPQKVKGVIELGAPKTGWIHNIPFDEAKDLPGHVWSLNITSDSDPFAPTPNSRSTRRGADRKVRSNHLGYGNNADVRRLVAGALQAHAEIYAPLKAS
jgi:pimeloyl-ACP methyl ester carboxylesterase